MGGVARGAPSNLPLAELQSRVAERNQPQPNALIGTELNPAIVEISKSPEDAAKEQRDEKRQTDSLYWNRASVISTGALTVALIGVGIYQLKTHRTQVHAVHEIERVYVKMAHSPTPPAPAGKPNGGRLHFLTYPNTSPTTDVWFSYGLKNCGRTPCNVLGGGMWYVVSNDPIQEPHWTTLDHPPIKVDPTFLVPGMTAFDKRCVTLDTDTANKIRVGAARYLWLVGYVDYRDRFNRFHRAGYGRFYDHLAMNLVFDRTTAAMNYDRELSPEERGQYTSDYSD